MNSRLSMDSLFADIFQPLLLIFPLFSLQGVIFNNRSGKRSACMKKQISAAEMPDQVELPEDLRQELDKRLAAYHRNPDEGSPWQSVKQRILAGR